MVLAQMPPWIKAWSKHCECRTVQSLLFLLHCAEAVFKSIWERRAECSPRCGQMATRDWCEWERFLVPWCLAPLWDQLWV